MEEFFGTKKLKMAEDSYKEDDNISNSTLFSGSCPSSLKDFCTPPGIVRMTSDSFFLPSLGPHTIATLTDLPGGTVPFSGRHTKALPVHTCVCAYCYMCGYMYIVMCTLLCVHCYVYIVMSICICTLLCVCVHCYVYVYIVMCGGGK